MVDITHGVRYFDANFCFTIFTLPSPRSASMQLLFFIQRYSVRMYEIFVPFKGFLVNTNTGHLGITPVSFKSNEQMNNIFHIHVYVWTECRHSNNHLLLDNFTGCLYNCYQVISQVGLHLSDQSWGGHSFNSWLCKT